MTETILHKHPAHDPMNYTWKPSATRYSRELVGGGFVIEWETLTWNGEAFVITRGFPSEAAAQRHLRENPATRQVVNGKFV